MSLNINIYLFKIAILKFGDKSTQLIIPCCYNNFELLSIYIIIPNHFIYEVYKINFYIKI